MINLAVLDKAIDREMFTPGLAIFGILAVIGLILWIWIRNNN